MEEINAAYDGGNARACVVLQQEPPPHSFLETSILICTKQLSNQVTVYTLLSFA